MSTEETASPIRMDHHSAHATPTHSLSALPSTSAFHANGKDSYHERDRSSTRSISGPGSGMGIGGTPKPNRTASSSRSMRKVSEKALTGLGTPSSGMTPTTSSNQPLPPIPPVPAAIQSPRTRYRHTPHLPHGPAENAPPTVMYWSKAPVWGHLPTRNMRAHTVTLVDSIAWVYGGCDDRTCWKDVWCFDVETFQWTHPEMTGDLPPPCRAHTATLVDRRIFVFGGGEGATYFNSLYILDTITRRWHHVKPTTGALPPPRRAHTTVLYQNCLYVFGGGTGERPLNDVWCMDVSVPIEKMHWEEIIITEGPQPGPRGYHTANLVTNMMVVMGGSDGRGSFNDVWVLNMGLFCLRSEAHYPSG